MFQSNYVTTMTKWSPWQSDEFANELQWRAITRSVAWPSQRDSGPAHLCFGAAGIWPLQYVWRQLLTLALLLLLCATLPSLPLCMKRRSPKPVWALSSGGYRHPLIWGDPLLAQDPSITPISARRPNNLFVCMSSQSFALQHWIRCYLSRPVCFVWSELI